jgi:hypothetical protein
VSTQGPFVRNAPAPVGVRETGMATTICAHHYDKVSILVMSRRRVCKYVADTPDQECKLDRTRFPPSACLDPPLRPWIYLAYSPS